MDPLYLALFYFRRRKYDECIKVCETELDKTPLDQTFWMLKMRCLTNQVYYDDVEGDEEGIAEILMDDNAIQSSPRPGTSLKSADNSVYSSQSSGPLARPLTQSGRPLTGMLRPGTQGNRTVINIENTLKTPRTAKSSRPMSTSSARYVRIGTASMISQSKGAFINLSRLNVNKYAGESSIALPLFEYLIYQENDIRRALELASKAVQLTDGQVWIWKLLLGKCYYKVNLLRDAEVQFRSTILHPESSVDAFLWLGKIYLRLDQPLSALEIYQKGLIKFPGETFLIAYAARVHEALMQINESIKLYKSILQIEAINVESIACLAMHHFYSNEPEIGVRYYRRLLQMGTRNAEIYNNLALCCHYSQQFDMTITCFEKALQVAEDKSIVADIWYNIAIVAIASGDKQLANQALKLCLVAKNDHLEAYNNLGVLEMSKTNPNNDSLQRAKVYFQAATNNGSYLHEPYYNLALIGEKTGHYDLCYKSAKKALEIYPQFYAAQEIMNRVRGLYENV